jgi:hypothetical protein
VNKARNLAFSFALLVVLIAVALVPAVTPNWLGPQLLTLAVAVMLLSLPGAPQADIKRNLAIFKPLAVAALLPAAWMLLQIVPVPLGSIEHPAWRSAAAALTESKSGFESGLGSAAINFGHVSIDLGFTLRGLFGYLSLMALTFVTSVLTRNRDRAEMILAALCTVTTFSAVELLLSGDPNLFATGAWLQDSTARLVALAAFGTILNAALMVRAAERLATSDRQPGWRTTIGAMWLGTLCAGICLIALTRAATYDILIATAFGLTVVGVVVVVRRLSLGRWSIATICVAVLVAWGGVVALRFAANPSVSPLFRFARLDSAEAAAATLRMMADADWKGSGVGSYQALAAIYRDAAGEPGPAAINTLASMVLEWGRAGLLIAVVLLLQLVIVLVRGALSRNRDSFYAASAAGCLVTAFCEAYCDASFTDVTVQMLAAIVVGLGLAQTKGLRAS